MVVRVCLLIAIQDWNASILRAIYGHAATVEASLVACCKPKIEKRCICDRCSFMNKCLLFPVYESHHAPPHHSWLFVFETCLQSHTHTWLTWDFGIPASRKFWCSLAPPSHGIDRGSFYKVAHTARTSGQNAISRPLIDNWQRSVLPNGFFTWTFENGFFGSIWIAIRLVLGYT